MYICIYIRDISDVKTDVSLTKNSQLLVFITGAMRNRNPRRYICMYICLIGMRHTTSYWAAPAPQNSDSLKHRSTGDRKGHAYLEFKYNFPSAERPACKHPQTIGGATDIPC
ncbi:hypothetical protein M5D96_004512 [Drosophila gunungcola]|uniref:Uncharacterized protein n=1 Tax=Drosophila gunungcola TaxID=103775 RepID=A0A9P9YUK5_9MUSC|nr:hypothetical protein M5D96_004512 [Drosophila gunungcola]